MSEGRVTRKTFLKRLAGATVLFLAPLSGSSPSARAAEGPPAKPAIGEPGYERRIAALLAQAGSRKL